MPNIQRQLHMLQKNDLRGEGEIEIHSDFLSFMPTALSRKRARKIGREPQELMDDPRGPNKCIICDNSLKPPGTSQVEVIIPDRVANFINDFPFLPEDQRVVFLWHSNLEVRKNCLHRFLLKDFGKIYFYWLLKGCIELGKKYVIPEQTLDIMRMVTGFNLGRLAGQSLTHFHMQYGWEVVLNPLTISHTELQLYFEELDSLDLIIYQSDRVKVVAPWTPKGQYALDLYFNDKYDICEMEDEDIKIFTVIGHRILKKYLDLGIQNLNIVFTNSPKGHRIEPLVVHFVPRVNMTALYEIKGVNVVDTPPRKIAEEFLDEREGVNWS